KPGQIYASPLLYTPNSYKRQVVILATTRNNVFIVDADNGTVINMRNLGPSFPTAETINYCPDIQPDVGVVGTPIIDVNTETLYMWAKTRRPTKNQTAFHTDYEFYALDVMTLATKPNFPVTIDGMTGDNNPQAKFIAFNQLQRTALHIAKGVVYAGWGTHWYDCTYLNLQKPTIVIYLSSYNTALPIYQYTPINSDELPAHGWLFGVDMTSGAIVTHSATTWGPNGTQIFGGIWMGGTGFSTDREDRMFFSIGNTAAPAGVPSSAAPNNLVPTILPGHSIVSVQLKEGGGPLTPTSFFLPYRRAYLDALGGYLQGPNGKDDIILTIPLFGEMRGRAGAYPLEGGWLYAITAKSYLQVFQFGFNAQGNATLLTSTQADFTTAYGAGPPMTTSYQGQPGTGIVWYLDGFNGHLVAHEAVPVKGRMKLLLKYLLPSSTAKFVVPTFRRNRMFIPVDNGRFLCMGVK
ncbi:hypothetical protein HDU76_007078, partial [Blyttiomyces sp. JEL0837]